MIPTLHGDTCPYLEQLQMYFNDKVKYVHRDEHVRLILAQVVGNATTLAALEGTEEADLTDYMAQVGRRLSEAVSADPERAANKLHEAKSRYRFVG